MTDSFNLPTLGLLNTELQTGRNIDPKLLEDRAKQLEYTIQSFGISAWIIDIFLGPHFTNFYVEMPQGTRASQLQALHRDIASALGVREILIQGVAAQATMNIMVPNEVREAVPIWELIGSQELEDVPGPLPMALGKTVLGDPACFDLGSLQHLLIAGTTGSGKSMGIHAALVSMLFRLSPAQLRLILIDPKAAEFSFYERIPHLIAPIIFDADRAVSVLRWAIEHMDDRFRMLASISVRNLGAFNAKVDAAFEQGRPFKYHPAGERTSDNPVYQEAGVELVPLPPIVIAIDELGDLMTHAFDEIDPLLQRLVQRGHIVGIHLILSTERPSVGILSGAVKANLSSRLAFRVVSALESRIVLDEAGAEELADQGDALLKVAGGGLIRIHGAYVEDNNIQTIAEHWRGEGQPDYVIAEQSSDQTDNIYENAVSIVLETGKASASHLQRVLGIDYNLAAHLIDKMEDGGLLSPPNYLGHRDVYGYTGTGTGTGTGTDIDDLGPTIDAEPRPRFRWPWEK
ncbi:MAG: hypothetical protein CMN62_10190 [Sphingobium sp.]|mgnify:FL=1|nr:hypothetical protein [Sphingobium sp.]|tara:strand:+ start:958 stop:2505 length:1548 start_codon:yes stop_codon:yes gene_type:complete